MTAERNSDLFGARDTFETGSGKAVFYRLDVLERQGIAPVSKLPFSIKVLLEAALREMDGFTITRDDVATLAQWNATAPGSHEIPFKPGRVILQDFTGVPSVLDLAALREAMQQLGGDPQCINPLVPVDLVIDHSVQVDLFGSNTALFYNAEREFERNRERYEFLRWGQRAFDNFRVVPPATGIIHQVNLEYLATVVRTRTNGATVVFPDSLVGTDSHTTMINSLGVLGWGVGGIEAEAVMLGQPISMLMPEVIGFKIYGEWPEGATATDLALTVTQILRKQGVVGKFVEFFGPGVSAMSLADRATIANMAPEYGATMGFFPVDDETLRYLIGTGRSEELVERVERYTKENGLFRTGESAPDYSATFELDLATVEPSVAGPKRPQDRRALSAVKRAFQAALQAPVAERGFALPEEALARRATVVTPDGTNATIGHGTVVLAAITSCTNTSNPSVMLGAGLLARKAVERGLRVPPYVKTSLAPGSRVVNEYLTYAGLLPYLEALGFHIVGYGCTTCIGNSGPLPEAVVAAVQEGDLVVSAVLSGNRNFEGRINPYVKANYLASPPLVVAYALAGRVDIDFATEPIGIDRDGNPVSLREIWPTLDEVRHEVQRALLPEMFRRQYANVFDGNDAWNQIPVAEGALYEWRADSTYIQQPPFFVDLAPEPAPLRPILEARALAVLGDSITTDHISPAGGIAAESPAGQYLIARGVRPADFNAYGARRGNHEVLMRGTFANIRLKNHLVPGVEGGVTVHLPSGEQPSIYAAAMRYQDAGTPLIILAGQEYGTGSSRDWAAKGPALLGVKAVIAESFERIHRSNLVGMGILPLQFKPGENWRSLGLSGREVYDIEEIDDDIRPGAELTVRATGEDGHALRFQVIARLDTPVEVNYYRNGGILQTVLRSLARRGSSNGQRA